MSKDREKEIKYLLYIKSELIRQTKKEMKKLNAELEEISGQKRLTRQDESHRRKR